MLAALALSACGCTTLVDRQLRAEIAGHQSATDGTRGLIGALPQWGGGCLWPLVDLYTGSLFLQQQLLSSAALGVDWQVAVYYNASISTATTHLGPGWRHSYDIALLPGTPGPSDITIEWADGRVDVFTDDTAGGWIGPLALQGRRITPIVGGYALRTKHGLVYEFDLAGRLVRIVDRNAHPMTLTYDGFGRLMNVTDPAGRTCLYEYDGLDRLMRISGLPPLPIDFLYDGSGRLQRVTGAYPCEYQYDGLDRLVRAVDPNGTPIDFEYNPGLPVIYSVTAGTARRTFGYDQATLTTAVIDRLDATNNAVTLYQFDGLGRIVTVDDGVLGVASNLYGPLNLVEEHTDADGHLTQYEYDGLGNLLKHTDPTLAVTTYSYDPTFNLLTGIVDPLMKSWTWIRDPANGNLLEFRDPLLNATLYGYDGLGRLVTVRDPMMNVTTYGYDANSYLVSVRDPAGFTVSAVRNVRGAPQSVTDQESNVWTLTLNSKDEIDGVSAPGPPSAYSMTYTAAGILETVQDPLGQLTTYSYDPLNRLVRADGPMGVSRTWVRNDAGHVIRRMDALGATEFLERDPVGRLLSRTGSEGTTEYYIHDCCDLRTVTDPMGNTANLDYTLDHKLTHVGWPGIDHDYLYDAMDRLVQATRNRLGQPLIRYVHVYDDAGRRTQIQSPHLGRTVTVNHNANGDPTQVFDNLRPTPVNYGYNTRRLVANVTRPGAGSAVATYNARGQLQSLGYPGGVTSTYGYDPPSRLVSVQNQSPSFSASYSVTHDARGDRTAVIASTPATGPRNLHLGRDPRGRPDFEQYLPGGPTRSYTYDAADNRRTANADVYSYSPEHRLLSAGPTISQTWDLDRRVTRLVEPGQVTNFTYGADGMLESIERNGQTWNATLGPFGEVVRVVLPSSQQIWCSVDEADGRILRRTFHPAPGIQPSVESLYGVLRSQPIPTPIADYWGPGSLAGFRATMTDASGSPSQVATSTGALAADRYFGHFGDLQAHIGAQQPVQGYQGQDGISGLDGLFFRPKPYSDHLVVGLLGSMVTVDVVPARIPYAASTASLLEDGGLGTDGLLGDVDAAGSADDIDLGDIVRGLSESVFAQDPPPAPRPVVQLTDAQKADWANEFASNIERLGWWFGLWRFMWKVYNFERSRAIEEGRPVPPEIPDPFPPEDPLMGPFK